MRSFLLLLALPLCSRADDLAKADLTKLADPTQRPAEAARLARCDNKERFLTAYEFFPCPQPDDKPALHLLTASYDHDFQREPSSYEYQLENPGELFTDQQNSNPGEVLTPTLNSLVDRLLLIFDGTGQEIRPFGGNNYINHGYVYDFNMDGILERADSTNYGLREAPQHSIEVFELETIEPTPRPLLHVIFNWHPRRADDDNDWTFSCTDDDDDGFVEINFGPRTPRNAPDAERFVFRWDPETNSYTTREIPANAHIRILQPGETLSAIAKNGGLNYPLLNPYDDDDPAFTERTAPPAAHPPYTFASLRDASDENLFAFFNGTPLRDEWDEPEDAVADHLPKDFWSLPPRQAALAFADTNRRPTHRQRWKLAVDDRNGIKPPPSGWYHYHWGSSGCYSYSSHEFTLRFDDQQSWLLVSQYNSQGVVGRNPLADQSAYTVRVIDLSPDEARHLADTLFWLDRIRSWAPRGEGRSGLPNMGFSSSADGHASLHLRPDNADSREALSATVWAGGSVSGRWDDEYSPVICINLIEHLFGTALPAHLGDRWNVAPDLDRQGLGTDLKDRLKPRHDAGALAILTDTIREAFRRHNTSPIPPAALQSLVSCAGQEGLINLRPELKVLLASLPEPTAEEKEYERLRKRFRRDHFGTPLEDNPADHPGDYARYEELRRKRTGLPSAQLRKPLEHALHQLARAADPAELMRTALEDPKLATWALNRLRHSHPDAWADVLIEQFREGQLPARRNTFRTLAAGHPPGAKRLADMLSKGEAEQVRIELATFDLAQGNETSAHVDPLLNMLRHHVDELPRRTSAMQLLSELKLNPDQLAELTALLLKEIKNPQKSDYGSTTASTAIHTLARLPGADAHLPFLLTRSETGVNDILHLLPEGPERSRSLESLLRPRFKDSPGFMNDLFLSALAHDLRGLAPDIAAMATPNPGVPDGDGANYSGGRFKGPAGQRYHTAREVTALWNEPDPATRARMWIALILNRPYQFSTEYGNLTLHRTLRTRAAKAISHLPPEQRVSHISTLLNLSTPSPYTPDIYTWLHSLHP